MPCYNRRVVRLFEKTVLRPCTVPISGGEAFIPVWASGCQLSAMTVASLVMGPYLQSSLPYMWEFIFSFTGERLREEKRTKVGRRERSTLLNA